ncbi:hypothetical protein FSARC_8099 [Fusarium sarcochroum]|uniref:Uncharacterized protein n=1 Tax=Fusarium sarcochroum TaxID=1208366 RepID=A0A8H4X7L2_9HYPO|nr:hypothetical protein FSARC_8099 [Fusarium sarcochroum]
MTLNTRVKPPGLLTIALLTLSADLHIVYGQQWTSKDYCPTKIDAKISRGSQFGTASAVHEAMKTCSTVDELTIRMGTMGCTDICVHISLPFALDGSDRYLSAPSILELEGYSFDHSEWDTIVPERPHWSEEDGSWPTPSSTNPIVRWASDRYHRGRMFANKAKEGYWGPFSGPCGKADAWYKWRHVSKEQRSKDSTELWLDAMDFSRVHTLSIRESRGTTIKPNGTAFYHRFPKELPSLKSLAIGDRWDDDRVSTPAPESTASKRPKALDFILAFPVASLTSFSWTESGTCENDVFEAVLKHHGASLQELEWTSSEIDYDPRPVLSNSQLQSLGSLAPELTNLTIDLNRENNDWPYQKLKILAQSVSHLTNLTIYLNLQSEQKHNSSEMTIEPGYVPPQVQPMAQPLLTSDAARKMFDVLRKAQPNKELETVTFREGDWLRPLVGPVWDSVEDEDWKTDVRVWVVCTVFGPDGVRLDREPSCQAGNNSLTGTRM